MATQYQLLVDPTSVIVVGTEWSCSVRAYPFGVVLNLAALPPPIYTALVRGLVADSNPVKLERARLIIENLHKADVAQQTGITQATAALNQLITAPITVTVQDT